MTWNSGSCEPTTTETPSGLTCSDCGQPIVLRHARLLPQWCDSKAPKPAEHLVTTDQREAVSKLVRRAARELIAWRMAWRAVIDRNTELCAELRHHREQYAHVEREAATTERERDEARAEATRAACAEEELTQARAAIQRVRAQHRREDSTPWCAECVSDDRPEADYLYPCPTLRALDGEEA